MWLVVVAPKDPAEECCTLSILETFLWKAMKPFQTYSTWQCNYALAEKVVPHLASGINANNIGLRARLLKRHVEREECIPNSKLFSLVSGLVSQLVVQLVCDAVSVLWLVSKISCAIGETVWGLRWCNFHLSFAKVTVCLVLAAYQCFKWCLNGKSTTLEGLGSLISMPSYVHHPKLGDI